VADTRAVATVVTRGIAFAETVDVDLVEVTATVTDGRSKYVTGLPQAAFRVFEDGRSQTITHFASENVALDSGARHRRQRQHARVDGRR